MEKYYIYIAPNYEIRFRIDGNWFSFQDEDYYIEGNLENSEWKLQPYITRKSSTGMISRWPTSLEHIPYETLILFRKALGIKGLEYLLDRLVTLLEE